MGIIDWWQRNKEIDCEIVAVIRKILNEDMNDKLDVVNEATGRRRFDIIEHVVGKGNQNVLIIGGSRSGKTILGEFLAIKLPERKIIISFKKFLPTKRDFDIGYNWIDVSKIVPNLFADKQSHKEAFRTAFFADANSRGLTIDTILTKVGDIMNEEPKNFEEFFKILDRLAGRGNWEESIRNIIRSKEQLIQRATADARQGNIDFGKGNIVLDLGNLPDEESKTFFAEYYLRQINRIEEQTQREEQIRIITDEVWHLLADKRQKSVVGTILLQGAYYIHFLCITQNYTHLDKDYRSHFGSIFCFKNNNDEDGDAIRGGYGIFVSDAVKKLLQYQFIDLKWEFNEEIIPVWKLNFERLRTLKLETKAKSVFNESVESFVEEPQEIKEDAEKSNDYTSQILEVLGKSEFAMYGYQIAKEIGLSSDDAVKIRQPLRNLVKEDKLRIIKIQLRKKEVEYYYIPETEQGHNFMMNETEKDIVSEDWKIIFKATHGYSGYDFLIEKNGIQIIVEVETGNRKTLSEFEKRVAEYDKSVVIVISNKEQKERYSYLSCVQNDKARIGLIPELKEILKNWTK